MKKLAQAAVIFSVAALWHANGHAAGAISPSHFAGLAGEELKREVAAASAPTCYPGNFLGENGIWALLKRSDLNSQGTGYLNRFGSELLDFQPSPGEPSETTTVVPLISRVWWKAASPHYDAVERDLYNLWPALPEVGQLKGSYGPGTVASAEYSNGFWSVGTWSFCDDVRHAWQPPKGYEGDFARVMFYLLTVYPDGLEQIRGYGAPYVTSAYYPGIGEEAVRQLLVWHRMDAVDDVEMLRNDLFETVQGNRNPFVDTPSLVEYLWGSECGNPFQSTQGGGTVPDVDSSPLRAVYFLSEARINLKSPFVPADAQWSIDGSEAETAYIVPAELGVGVHELRFRSGNKSGKVKIEIKP